MKVISNATAVILCGGKSSRMGFDKALLKIHDGYLLEELAQELKKLFSNVILITDRKKKLESMDKLRGFRILEDLYPECGPLGAITTGFLETSDPYIFALACDIPKANISLIKSMYSQIEQNQILLLESQGKIEPLFSFYHRSVLPVFREQLEDGDYKIRKNFDKFTVSTYSVRDPESVLYNLNTPDDLKSWKEKNRKKKLQNQERGEE